MTELIATARSGFYAPYGFLDRHRGTGQDWIDELKGEIGSGAVTLFDGAGGVVIYFRALAWDTEFFAVPTFRVEFTHWPDGTPNQVIGAAFQALQATLAAAHETFYLFGEVPCEDTGTIAGMGSAAWRLIETRLTYYRDDLQKFEPKVRYAVRSADDHDIPLLRESSVQSVNHFDRFHADDFFTAEESDRILAAFVENSVKGFADEVMVPADGPANAFLTGNYVTSPPSLAGRKIGRMVLSAVSTERRGWYVKLIGELSQKFKERGIDTALMTTQATNRAVLKVWERHGYCFGRCTHIFSTYQRKR